MSTRISLSVWTLLAVALFPAVLPAAVQLQEPESSERTVQVSVSVTTTGSVFTAGSATKSQKHPLTANARYRFRERRLPPGGRDAAALRAIREFETAQLTNSISGRDTQIILPASQRIAVSAGDLTGVHSYCPTAMMSRETLDLLELPGDPLALTALLPSGEVEAGAKWKPNDWAVQMLASVDAVQKQEMNCELVSVKGSNATISFTGSVLGQRYGANTDVQLSGELTFQIEQKLISSARVNYTVKANIGTVSPGIDAKVESVVTRELASAPGKLTNALIEATPISPPAGTESLVFDAEPWKVQMVHSRSWHLFQAVLEGNSQVVIFRLMESGSLLCQCNVARIPSAAPGKTAPLDQFEADIQTSLGKRFKAMRKREQIPAEDGRIIHRVIAEGQNSLVKDKEAVEVPMQWNYYIVTAPTGEQLSFVFAIEPQLVEQLADRDLELVQSVRFVK